MCTRSKRQNTARSSWMSRSNLGLSRMDLISCLIKTLSVMTSAFSDPDHFPHHNAQLSLPADITLILQLEHPYLIGILEKTNSMEAPVTSYFSCIDALAAMHVPSTRGSIQGLTGTTALEHTEACNIFHSCPHCICCCLPKISVSLLLLRTQGIGRSVVSCSGLQTLNPHCC